MDINTIEKFILMNLRMTKFSSKIAHSIQLKLLEVSLEGPQRAYLVLCSSKQLMNQVKSQLKGLLVSLKED